MSSAAVELLERPSLYLRPQGSRIARQPAMTIDTISEFDVSEIIRALIGQQAKRLAPRDSLRCPFFEFEAPTQREPVLLHSVGRADLRQRRSHCRWSPG
jgi:hypothetical protein